jgi:hypothetical protein
MRNPAPDAKVAAALDEARQRLGFLHRLGALKSDEIEDPTRRRACFELRNPQFDLSARNYLLRLLEGQDPTPVPRRGRPTTKKRDYWIAQMVARLVNAYGPTPTRNRGNNPGHQRLTACEIVAQVLGEIGTTNINGASIEVIWSRRRLEDVEFDVLPLSFNLPPEYLDRLDEQLARKRERMKAQPASPVQQKS